ncbi:MULTISPECIES: hypothetical protein [unclassified Anaerobiospirillum]|uniref:hypothetical protein n=1 Tax=unclassified Anaerobiospirillum TaxID=2647410 RepID=UPI001FF586DD|nr:MULTISPECIES: hypothetical protein [unclassified Anaerobiospirillum]MCK0535458.1 hypothetical protein [Anaerobiospirillum sp. NML120511]MCK0539384.1 hypothetical protein [Anaerobiospirillum sp. NML02-A-032]
MDFKPVPPDGRVHDLRSAQEKSQSNCSDGQCSKEQKNDRVRRNLRIVALVIAAYYFASAGWSWYQESEHASNATIAANISNPLKDPVAFRDTFNSLINEQDTSLPTANANDTPEGFVAVLSTAVEMKGTAKPNSRELQSVQIQTRYPEGLPPESLVAFRTFILTNERLFDSAADVKLANTVLSSLGVTPEFDANEDNKNFEPLNVLTHGYLYQTTFTSGPIDELTLVVTPRVNVDDSAQPVGNKVIDLTSTIAAPAAAAPAAENTAADNTAAADTAATADTADSASAKTDAAESAPSAAEANAGADTDDAVAPAGEDDAANSMSAAETNSTEEPAPSAAAAAGGAEGQSMAEEQEAMQAESDVPSI